MNISEKQEFAAANPELYITSAGKVFWLNLLSLGIYSMYWFYKNWAALNRAGAKVNPTLRGWILPMFFVFQLFAIIKNKINAGLITKVFCWLAPIFFWFYMVLSFTGRVEYIGTWLLMCLLGLIVLSVALYAVQKAVNKHYPQAKGKFFSWGELATVLFVPLLLFAVAFLGYVSGKKAATLEAEKFMTAITFKHLHAYPKICARNGYVLQQYQREFINHFTPELLRYNRHLAAQGINEGLAWQRQPQTSIDNLKQSAAADLEFLRRMMAEKVADAKISDACKVLDGQGASAILQIIEDEIRRQAGRL